MILVSPQAFHQFRSLNLELLSIDLRKLLESEGPAVQAGAEPHCTLCWVHLKETRGAPYDMYSDTPPTLHTHAQNPVGQLHKHAGTNTVCMQ